MPTQHHSRNTLREVAKFANEFARKSPDLVTVLSILVVVLVSGRAVAQVNFDHLSTEPRDGITMEQSPYPHNVLFRLLAGGSFDLRLTRIPGCEGWALADRFNVQFLYRAGAKTLAFLAEAKKPLTLLVYRAGPSRQTRCISNMRSALIIFNNPESASYYVLVGVQNKLDLNTRADLYISEIQ